jgi:tRNA dimethylallyltransferase
MIKVIAIVGPTASGKSSLGMYLAQKLNGEIISADSRQIYKGMQIISRAPSKKELRAVRHHFVAIADPKRVYTAGTFARAAGNTMSAIQKRDGIPLVVGGAGFYADALLSGLSLPDVKPDKKMRAKLTKKTPAQLVAMLKKHDRKSALRVDSKNKVRLIRAIEIARAIGKVPTRAHSPTYDVLWLGRSPAEKVHTKAITRGVHDRLRLGMAKEAKKLQTTLSRKRFISLGFEYDLLDRYIRKEITKEELIESISRGERKYAKRQMRWFKRNPNIRWIESKTEALRLAKDFLKN